MSGTLGDIDDKQHERVVSKKNCPVFESVVRIPVDRAAPGKPQNHGFRVTGRLLQGRAPPLGLDFVLHRAALLDTNSKHSGRP